MTALVHILRNNTTCHGSPHRESIIIASRRATCVCPRHPAGRRNGFLFQSSMSFFFPRVRTWKAEVIPTHSDRNTPVSVCPFGEGWLYYFDTYSTRVPFCFSRLCLYFIDWRAGHRGWSVGGIEGRTNIGMRKWGGVGGLCTCNREREKDHLQRHTNMDIY
jgi:hypothetical protein